MRAAASVSEISWMLDYYCKYDNLQLDEATDCQLGVQDAPSVARVRNLSTKQNGSLV